MAKPVPLLHDFARHEPAAVRLTSSVGNRFLSYELTSRYVRLGGMILEIFPALTEMTLLHLGEQLDLRVRLPHREDVLFVTAAVHRIVPLAVDVNGKRLTVAGMKFAELSAESRLILEAHELTSQVGQRIERSARIPVRFPIELSGMDVLTPLIARDLSMTGMFVGGRVKFEPGKILRLNFKLPFQQRPVAVRGRVVWHGQKPVPGVTDLCPGFGVQFVEVPPASQTAIATYYAKNTIV
ncbi:MAG: PilZ domain-containing protein [Pseudomonadota bacterium]